MKPSYLTWGWFRVRYTPHCWPLDSPGVRFALGEIPVYDSIPHHLPAASFFSIFIHYVKPYRRLRTYVGCSNVGQIFGWSSGLYTTSPNRRGKWESGRDTLEGEVQKGLLLIGIAMDGNYQICPVTFAIVDKEYDASWKWFMANLKNVIGEPYDLVIISYYKISIVNAVRAIFPKTFYGMCTYHLSMNLRSRFKNDTATKLFRSQVRIPQLTVQVLLGPTCSVSKCSYGQILTGDWAERWAHCYQVKWRYINMTTNNVESINSILREVRELPVTLVLGYIRDMLQRWFHERWNYSEYVEIFLHSCLRSRIRIKLNKWLV